VAPDGVTVKVTPHSRWTRLCNALSTITLLKPHSQALRNYLWIRPPIPQRSGSYPYRFPFRRRKELKSKTILMGVCGWIVDAIHSPNSILGVWNYLKGIETSLFFYHYSQELLQIINQPSIKAGSWSLILPDKLPWEEVFQFIPTLHYLFLWRSPSGSLLFRYYLFLASFQAVLQGFGNLVGLEPQTKP